jgi:hypothetical protein
MPSASEVGLTLFFRRAASARRREDAMKYAYGAVRPPGSPHQWRRIEDSAERVERAATSLAVDQLPISDYTRRYLGEHLHDLRGLLQHHAHLLGLVLSEHALGGSLPHTLVDYGGGVGALSWLARAAGVPCVIYNDIYDVSCRDARVIAAAMGLEADDYVEGDLDGLIGRMKARGRPAQAVASFNVIEHVYDVEAFLRGLAELGDRPLAVAMATDANSHNPWRRARLMAVQRRVEREDRPATRGHKGRDSLKSYRAIRAELIAARAPGLSPQQVNDLADRTRGLRKDDIDRAVEDFLRCGRMPPAPDHPTNTCDPMTGNWAEHLMRAEHLRGVLIAAGFSRAWVRPGYYAGSGRPLKSVAAWGLNLMTRAAGPWGLCLASYYVLGGARDQ